MICLRRTLAALFGSHAAFFGALFFGLVTLVAPPAAEAKTKTHRAPAATALETPLEACTDLATIPEVLLAGVRPDFEHNTKYTTEVKTTEIKDQCAVRSCWIYSGISNLEQRILTHSGKSVDLSEQYLIVQAMRLRAVDALDHPGEQFSPGGAPGNVDWLVDTYGIVPDKAWKPRVDFQKEAIAKRMFYFVNARLARFHLENAKTTSVIEKQALYEAAKTDLLDLIESYSGPLPKVFTFDGASYSSPIDYAKKAIPPDPRPTVYYTPTHDKLPDSVRDALADTGGHGPTAPIEPHFETQKLPLDEIGEKIKQALARGESVRIGYESVHEFVDDKTGIMSIGAFFIPKGFEPPPSQYRSHFDFKGIGHAVEVVGVDVGSDGKIIKLKLKNSHGEDVGDHGFMHMYWDYFKAFMHGVYIREQTS